jgi:hypothetical protein
VIEVINADALVVKTPDGSSKKLFLSSLRPPRLPTREDGSQVLQDAGGLLHPSSTNSSLSMFLFFRNKLLATKERDLFMMFLTCSKHENL